MQNYILTAVVLGMAIIGIFVGSYVYKNQSVPVSQEIPSQLTPTLVPIGVIDETVPTPVVMTLPQKIVSITPDEIKVGASESATDSATMTLSNNPSAVKVYRREGGKLVEVGLGELKQNAEVMVNIITPGELVAVVIK